MFRCISGRWTCKVVQPLLALLLLLLFLLRNLSMHLVPNECERSTNNYIEDLDPECFHAASFIHHERRNSSRSSVFKGNHKIKETALEMKKLISELKAHTTVLTHMKELNRLENRAEYLLSLFEEDDEGVPEKPAAERNESLLVCPETYLGSAKGYPFFYTGFAISNCTSARPFNQVLSILINHIENPIDLFTLCDRIRNSYPDVIIFIATTWKKYARLHSEFMNIKVHLLKEGASPIEAWNLLFMNATTPYVLVARDMINFSWDVRLERLVREAQLQEMDFVGGAIRNQSGYWDVGCYQTKSRNYSLEYIPGYYYSLHECLYCSYLAGPFVARTEAIQYLRLRYDISDNIAFEDLFFRFAHKHKSHSLLCPDSMFYVRDSMRRNSNLDVWKKFSRKYEINRVVLPSGKILDLCSTSVCTKSSVKSLPRCCMEKLSSTIKILMKSCESIGMMCELQEGTLLGAVKLAGILPWERDADLTFHTQNFSSLEKLGSMLQPHGITLRINKKPWCCVDGVEAGGVALVTSSAWHIEFYGQHLMDSEKLRNNGQPPTRLQLDGQWVAVPHNPGLYVRNRYGSGREIYRHALHWMTSGMKSGWEKYDTTKFPPCNDPGHHACLDQYSTDGNIQFRDDQ